MDVPIKRQSHNSENVVFVILNEVKNLIILATCNIEILRLKPQNDITTQSLNRGMTTKDKQCIYLTDI